MQYKKVIKPKLVFKYRATDILYKKMMFYHNKASIITEALIKIVQNQQQARGDLLIQLHRDLHKFNDIVIDCASKLAPYQSPKKESIEVHNEYVHKFVIAAPKVYKDKDKWLESVKSEKKLIEAQPSIIDAEYKEIDKGKLN